MPLSIDEFESGELPSGPSVPEQVVRYLLSNSDQAFTRAEIASAIEEAPNTVGTALSRLKDRDLVRHKGEYWAITDDIEYVRAAYGLHIASERLDDDDGGIDTDAWHNTAPETAHPSERTGPNAVELLLGALGSCLSVGYAANAAHMDIELADLRFEMEGDVDLRGFLGISENVRPGYESITCTVYVDADATEDELSALRERVEKTSPLMDAITNEVPLETRLVSE